MADDPLFERRDVRVDSSTDLTIAVADAVENCAAAPRTDLPVLLDAVDPDAVAAVLATADDATVTFRYAGYRVRVDTDGRVRVMDE